MSQTSTTPEGPLELEALWAERGTSCPACLDDADCDRIALVLGGYQAVWTLETVRPAGDVTAQCIAGRWRPQRVPAPWFAALAGTSDRSPAQREADLACLLAELEAQFALLANCGGGARPLKDARF